MSWQNLCINPGQKSLAWKGALELTKEIDEFDTPFITLSLELKAPLWTGDKKLYQELKDQGYDLGLNTEEIKKLRG